MLIALDKEQNRTIAYKADKKLQYFCQECGEQLSLRQGKIRRPHFAHKAGSNCESAHCNKTEWHYEWQELFGIDYAERVIQVAGVKHIADILLGDTVVEFQHSKISKEDVAERNELYRIHNLNVVWVFDCCKDCEDGTLYPYEKRPNFNWLFEWHKPNDSVLTAAFNSSVYLQVSDNCLLEVTWFPNGYDERKDDSWYSMKKFAANIMDKKHAIAKIKQSANIDGKPQLIQPDWMIDELIDMARACC